MLGISGEGKPNGVNPACPVRPAVLWPTSLALQLRAEGSTGRTRASAPAFPFSHFQESTLVCTAAQYNAGQVHGTGAPRTGTA